MQRMLCMQSFNRINHQWINLFIRNSNVSRTHMKTIQVLNTNFSGCFILDFFLTCQEYFSECWKTKVFSFSKDWNMLFVWCASRLFGTDEAEMGLSAYRWLDLAYEVQRKKLCYFSNAVATSMCFLPFAGGMRMTLYEWRCKSWTSNR